MLDDTMGVIAGIVAGSEKIGRVVSVSGSQIISLIHGGKPGRSEPSRQVQIGSLVKMYTAESTVFGMISGFSIPIPAQDPSESELKIAELDLIGETVRHENEVIFQRGVSSFPALGADVFTATKADLSMVYARPAVSTVRIGTIHQDKTLPAFVVIDDLLGKHFAILGTTGSGKSCGVALILHAILEKHDSAHMVLLDPHGEYANSFGDKAEVLDSSNLQLPYWLFNFEEISEIIFGGGSSEWEAEGSILRETIQMAKMRLVSEPDEQSLMTVDTPIPYKLSEVLRLIDEAAGKLERRSDLTPYLRLKNRLNVLQADRRFSFMFPAGVVLRDNMVQILSRIFRMPAAGKPIAIIDSLRHSVRSDQRRRLACSARMTLRRSRCGAIARCRSCWSARRRIGTRRRIRSRSSSRRSGRFRASPRKVASTACLAVRRHPAPVRAGGRAAVPVQHDLRPAHEQPEGPGVRQRRDLGRDARPARLAALAAERRSDRRRRGCLRPDAAAFRRVAGGPAPAQRQCALLGGVAGGQ